MVIVDLTATVVAKPGAFARDLLAPARLFERAGQCLLLLGASPELTAALDRYPVPVVTSPPTRHLRRQHEAAVREPGQRRLRRR